MAETETLTQETLLVTWEALASFSIQNSLIDRGDFLPIEDGKYVPVESMLHEVTGKWIGTKCVDERSIGNLKWGKDVEQSNPEQFTDMAGGIYGLLPILASYDYNYEVSMELLVKMQILPSIHSAEDANVCESTLACACGRRGLAAEFGRRWYDLLGIDYQEDLSTLDEQVTEDYNEGKILFLDLKEGGHNPNAKLLFSASRTKVIDTDNIEVEGSTQDTHEYFNMDIGVMFERLKEGLGNEELAREITIKLITDTIATVYVLSGGEAFKNWGGEGDIGFGVVPSSDSDQTELILGMINDAMSHLNNNDELLNQLALEHSQENEH